MRFHLLPILFAGLVTGHAPATEFQHFEARQAHPIELTADASRLLALNSPDAKLSVLDATSDPPLLLNEIPVGLEPVSVRCRTNDEAWVVSEVSDSVSIVALDTGTVLASLRTGDEPADVAFAQGKAFITCARQGKIMVFDTNTHALITTIDVQGSYPRNLAVSGDGLRVYAVCELSGNHTTVLNASAAPAPPSPTNAALPLAPQTALIIADSDVRIHYTVLDHDVVEIDATANTVSRYFADTGTNLFDVVTRPGTDELWIANTDALNLRRFEPTLRGHFSNSRVTRLNVGTSQVTAFDLNPSIDYGMLPNPSAQAVALAQPTGMVFTNDGAFAWVVAFGSDRVAKINPATGSVATRVDLRTGDASSRNMRGSRGLALNENAGLLYVLNKLSNTISIVSTTTLTVEAEIAIGKNNPVPLEVQQGRGLLFDARLSGNGTTSCTTCHLDADRDGLAWDLGNPGGELTTTLGANLIVDDTKTRSRISHPMKGPMTTQTLRGIQGGSPFHWRGDKPSLQSFDATFENLMGGELPTSEEMNMLSAYLLSLVHHPNPNRQLDRSLPTTFNNSDPSRGKILFDSHLNHCGICHAGDRGSNNNIDLTQEVGGTQPMKSPSLRTVYQRMLFDPGTGHTSTSGFGLLHDGTGASSALPTVHPYVLDNFTTTADYADVAAYVLCFDTGTAPTVGYSVQVNPSNKNDTGVLSDIAILEARAIAGDCDLIVRGVIAGQVRSLLYSAAGYRFDKALSGTVMRSALLGMFTTGDSLTFMGVLPGMGQTLSIDHNGDGILDGDEVPGSPTIVGQPTDVVIAPGASATLNVEATGNGLHYQWKSGTTNVGSDSNTFTAAAAGSYSANVSNTFGTATSRIAVVTVTSAPVITVHPASKLVSPTQDAVLSVTATGSGLTYQWLKNGSTLIGATTSTLTLTSAQAGDSGIYSVMVSNGAGSVTSKTAQLTVPVPPVVNALNLPDARVGENYSKQVTAQYNPTSFTITGLPPGLIYDASTGLITGHPTAPGIATVKVIASNVAGDSAQVADDMAVFDLAAGTVGSYQGVVARQAVLNDDLGGRITITTAAAGTFTGTLVLGLQPYPLVGTLNPSGVSVDSTAQVTIPRKGMSPLTVNLTFTPTTRSLIGSLSDGSSTANLTARQPSATASVFAGSYTFGMLVKPADRSNEAVPQGHNFGAFKVTNTGAATGMFKLCDGTVVTFSNTIEADGSLSQFKLLNANTGSLLGSLNIDGANGFTMAASQMSWLKKAQPTKSTTRSYKAGFASIDLEAHGGRYTIPPNGVIPLGLVAGTNNAKLSFFGGGAPSPATRLNLNTIEVVAGNPSNARIISANPGIVTLMITPGSGSTFGVGTTGTFSGTFMLLDPDTTVQPNKPVTRTATFTGVIANDGASTRGYGFYQLPELPSLLPTKTTISTSKVLSGSVTLEATP